MSAPRRIQRRRTAGWRMPEGAVYVGRPTKWGNPFGYRQHTGLVRFRPSDPGDWEYEGRISAHGNRHDYFHPDGTVTHYEVRYATRHELVAMYRATLLNPDRGMRGAWPSRAGHFLNVALVDIVAELEGRDLACWCPLNQPCHADVLLHMANGGASWCDYQPHVAEVIDAALGSDPSQTSTESGRDPSRRSRPQPPQRVDQVAMPDTKEATR